jgi:hypothetical protein
LTVDLMQLDLCIEPNSEDGKVLMLVMQDGRAMILRDSEGAQCRVEEWHAALEPVCRAVR